MEIMKLLCRMCGKEDKNCIPIFSESGKKQLIEKKIRFCTPLIIEETDIMPKQVCLSCLHKLDGAWELNTLCREGQISIEKKLHYIIRAKEKQEALNFSINRIEEKLRFLSETNSITFGDTAKVSIVPSSPPPPVIPKISAGPVTPVLVAAGPTSSDTMLNVLPAQNMIVNPSPVTYMQTTRADNMAPVPAPAPTKEGGYPERLLQENPNNKPVVYQQRNVRRQVPVPTPKRSAPLPKPLPTPRRSLPAPSSRRRTLGDSNNSVPPPKRALQMCKYCNKTFPEDIIDHHVNLHLRQSFFTCIDCNKNFRSEEALSRHRCNTNDTIDLDADDEPICV